MIWLPIANGYIAINISSLMPIQIWETRYDLFSIRFRDAHKIFKNLQRALRWRQTGVDYSRTGVPIVYHAAVTSTALGLFRHVVRLVPVKQNKKANLILETKDTYETHKVRASTKFG